MTIKFTDEATKLAEDVIVSDTPLEPRDVILSLTNFRATNDYDGALLFLEAWFASSEDSGVSKLIKYAKAHKEDHEIKGGLAWLRADPSLVAVRGLNEPAPEVLAELVRQQTARDEALKDWFKTRLISHERLEVKVAKNNDVLDDLARLTTI